MGINVYGQVIIGAYEDKINSSRDIEQEQREWLAAHRLRGFYNLVISDNYSQGVQSLLQLSGLGKLRPNLLFIGYPNNWTGLDDTQLDNYLNIIHWTFDIEFGVCIFRLQNRENYFERKDKHYSFKIGRFVCENIFHISFLPIKTTFLDHLCDVPTWSKCLDGHCPI